MWMTARRRAEWIPIGDGSVRGSTNNPPGSRSSTGSTMRRYENGGGPGTLEAALVARLRRLPKTRGGIVKFPNVFRTVCLGVSVPKAEGWKVLRDLRGHGLIEMVPFKGIRITDNVRDGDRRWQS